MIAGRQQTFTEMVLAEWRSIPAVGLTYLGGWGVLSAGSDLFAWFHRPTYGPADYVLAAVDVIAMVAISYSCAAWMVGAPRTLWSALKFIGTGLLVFMPLVLAFGLLLLAARAKIQWAVILASLMMFTALLPMTLLTGWPVWQMVSDRFIGPFEALNATRGFRWRLFWASAFVSGLNRGFPSTSKAADLLSACGLAFGNGVVGCLTTVIGLSIGVAAYRKMLASGQVQQG